MTDKEFIICALSGVAIGLAIFLGGIIVFVRFFQ